MAENIRLENRNQPATQSLLHTLQSARSIVCLTGAGISAESGIPTFRGPGGYWKQYRAEELASPEGFQENPTLVWEWYTERRRLIQGSAPNPGHYAIAALEKYFPDFLLITQNVDGYHRDAGSSQLVELHGNIWKVRCTQETYRIWEDRTLYTEFPVQCECGALARPHILWFGEMYDMQLIHQSQQAIATADVLLVIGTSGMVGIVHGLLGCASKSVIVEINMTPSEVTPTADYFIQGPAGEILPNLLKQISS